MLEVTDVLVLTISVFLIFLAKLVDQNPFPIFGIYQRPNGFYWFKVAFIYLALSVRKIKLRQKGVDRSICDLEKTQLLVHQEKAEDAVYLNGANKNGDHIIFGISRRKNQLVDNYFYLNINKVGLLGSPILPDTTLYETENQEPYSVGGLKFTLIEPMKKWRFIYDGKLKELKNGSKLHDVRIDGIWTSNLPYFDFLKDMDPLCIAKSLAYEKLSQNYFDILQEEQEIHYEQFGTLKTTVTVDNINYNIELDSLRGHISGNKREWRRYKRYAMHFFSTENGDYFSLGKICKPIAYSRLTMGYVYSAEAKAIFPIQDCDLELYQHGASGNPPTDYAFSYIAGNKKHSVRVNVLDSAYFYISTDWEGKMFESLCKFEVNGVKGWGAAEWQYRNIEGKHQPDYLKKIKDI